MTDSRTTQPLVASREVLIEFGDCDPAGIVFYPNYFRIFDGCTAGLFRLALGDAKTAWTKRFGILGIPMVDTGARFRIPSRYGERVRIETRIESIGKSSLKIAHVLSQAGVVRVEGWETRVWAAGTAGEPQTIRGIPVPDEVRQALGHPPTAG